MVALAEAAIGGPYSEGVFGASLDLSAYTDGMAAEKLLFGEDGARAMVSCRPDRGERVMALARQKGVPCFEAGTVSAPGSPLAVRLADESIEWDPAALRKIYFDAIPRRMREDRDRS